MSPEQIQQMMQQYGLTPAADFRKPRIVTLPSGRVVALREADIFQFIGSDGRLMDALGPLMFQKQDDEAAEEMDFQHLLPVIAPLMERMVKEVFEYPRVVGDPKADWEISPSHLSMADKMFVLNISMGSVPQAVKTFPDQQKGIVDALQNRPDIPPAPVRPVGADRK